MKTVSGNKDCEPWDEMEGDGRRKEKGKETFYVNTR